VGTASLEVAEVAVAAEAEAEAVAAGAVQVGIAPLQIPQNHPGIF